MAKSLYEKIQETDPGRHAAAIGEAIYRARSAIGKECCDWLTQAQTYLEKLALEELRRAEPWAAELARKTGSE